MSVLSCLHFHYLCGNKFWQDMNLTKYERRPSREVRIGRVVIGGDRPIAVQSMTNTDTKDTEACIRQIERIFRAGGPIVRLTAQGRREGENLERIVRRLREEGCDAAVVADIHFVPEVAAIAAKYVDKVRINPGNYNSSHGEFEALIDRCRERGVAIRIGVNHGSLSKRVFDEWGDTPEGMVASAMEFLRVCREKAFDQVVVSMKSSNTRVMVAAYRLLAEAMEREGMDYPLHLGVTEAGNGIEGRIKSAVGIGALTVVGQCLGAGEKVQAKRYSRLLLLTAYAGDWVMNLSGLFFLNKLALSWFNLSPEAYGMALELMVWFNAVSLILWPSSFTLPNILRAAGDAAFTMTISVISMWVFRVAFCYLMVLKFHCGLLFIWMGMFLDWAMRSLFFCVRFVRGRWMEQKVI